MGFLVNASTLVIPSQFDRRGICFLQRNTARYNEAMSPEVSDLLKRALALSVDERAALANTLLDSLETTNQSVEQAWAEEVARRIEDLKTGKAVTVPWEQLHRELLAIVNEP
jgi:putative addiction module component (TIGR02574 family)